MGRLSGRTEVLVLTPTSGGMCIVTLDVGGLYIIDGR